MRVGLSEKQKKRIPLAHLFIFHHASLVVDVEWTLPF